MGLNQLNKPILQTHKKIQILKTQATETTIEAMLYKYYLEQTNV